MELTTKHKNGDFLYPFWTDLFNSERFFDRLPLVEPVFSSPPANVIENGHSFKVELAVPGFSKDDFKVEIDDNVLSISAEKEEELESKEERYMRNEFRYVSFSRSFTLPKNCEDSKIEANYSDGILSLVVPKKEITTDRKKKEIKVK